MGDAVTTLEMRAGITCALPFRSLYPIYRDGELCAFLGSLAGYGLPWELCPIKLALTPNAGWEGCMPNTDAQAGARFLNVKKRHIASAVSIEIIESCVASFPGRCALLAAKAESVLKLAEDLRNESFDRAALIAQYKSFGRAFNRLAGLYPVGREEYAAINWAHGICLQFLKDVESQK